MIGAAEMPAMQQRTGALLVLASAVAFGVMPVFGKLAFDVSSPHGYIVYAPNLDGQPLAEWKY